MGNADARYLCLLRITNHRDNLRPLLQGAQHADIITTVGSGLGGAGQRFIKRFSRPKGPLSPDGVLFLAFLAALLGRKTRNLAFVPVQTFEVGGHLVMHALGPLGILGRQVVALAHVFVEIK
jgi:hypothetical protein